MKTTLHSRSRTLLPALFALVVLEAGAASASATFPAVLRDYPEAGMQREGGESCTPSCEVCHSNPTGGFGTVTTPFGVSLFEAGLRAGDEDSLVDALDQLLMEETDSDEDGVSDIDEISNPSPSSELDPSGAWNPNEVGAKPAICEDIPRYGCGARLSPESASWPAGIFAGLTVGLLFWRRRRFG